MAAAAGSGLQMTTGKKEEFVEGGNIKGGMLRAHLDWLEKNYGPDEVARVLGRLQPVTHALVTGPILASGWYRFASLVELDRAIVETLMNGEIRGLRRLGAFSAVQNLSSTYRLFARNTPHEFFERSALLHRQFQDFGSAEYDRTGETSAVLHHRNYRCFSPVYCESALGYYEEILRLHGAKNVRVFETDCHCEGQRSCSFVMNWR